MDTRGFHTPPLEPPPPSPPSSIASFPILAISIIGILTTSILLLTYYVFVIKCCLHRHYPDVLLRLSWSRRSGHNMSPPTAARSGGGARLGLSESAIRAIPSFRYTKQSERARECAVCLNEFQEEERVRLLPSCRHVFHIDCVDAWLQSHPNCPLCRSNVTAPLPVDHLMALATHFDPRPRNEVALQVRDGLGAELIAQVPYKSEQRFRQHKKLEYLTSRGDECLDARRRGDELFCSQPMRRSFSMDSSADRQLHVALQKILQQRGESSSSSTRIRRSFFSFGRSSRGAVLPLQTEQRSKRAIAVPDSSFQIY